MAFVYIEEEELQPEFQFVKTAVNPSREEYDLNLLPNQYIKVKGNPSKFIMSDESWKVSANKRDRNKHKVGTVFQIRGCTWQDNGRKQWVIASDRDMLEPIEYMDAVDKIVKYQEKIIGDGVFEEPERTEDEAPVPSSSYLVDVLDKYRCPTIAKDGFYVSDRNWKQLARHIDRKKNVLIIGDSGTGKTELCQLLADRFGKNLVTHDMGATQDPIASLIGVHRMEDGKSVFDLADFVSDIQEPNVILLDEVNRAPLNSNNILFPLLDRRRTLRLSIASSKLAREVNVDPEVVFLATANIGTEFTGTNVIDTAFANRFVIVELGYPPSNVEENLLNKRTGVDKEYAKKIVKVAKGIREKRKAEDISMGMSIRQTIEVAEMVFDGFTVKEALECYLEPIFKEEYADIKDILQSI